MASAGQVTAGQQLAVVSAPGLIWISPCHAQGIPAATTQMPVWSPHVSPLTPGKLPGLTTPTSLCSCAMPRCVALMFLGIWSRYPYVRCWSWSGHDANIYHQQPDHDSDHVAHDWGHRPTGGSLTEVICSPRSRSPMSLVGSASGGVALRAHLLASREERTSDWAKHERRQPLFGLVWSTAQQLTTHV